MSNEHMTDQQFLDRCAIEAMKSFIVKERIPPNGEIEEYLEGLTAISFHTAEAMLAERNKRIEEMKNAAK